MKYINYTIILFFLFSCNQKKEKVNGFPSGSKMGDTTLYASNTAKSIHFEKICRLEENIDVFKSINSFDVTSEDRFVVSTTNGAIYIYDFEGNQIQEIGHQGNAPSEFLQPTIVKNIGDYIYVWCAFSLKVLQYDQNGKFVAAYSGLNRAIIDFAIYRDTLIAYTGGGFQDSYISFYDMKRKSIVYGMEKPSQEHILLSLRDGQKGNLALYGNNMIYSSLDELSIINYDLENLTKYEIKIKDPNFKVNKVNVNSVNDHINQNRMDAVNYLLKNSTVSGIYVTKDYIILGAETGYFEMEKDGMVNSQHRYMNLYRIDRENMRLDVFKIGNNMSQMLFCTYGDDMYCVKVNMEIEDEEPFYELHKMIF